MHELLIQDLESENKLLEFEIQNRIFKIFVQYDPNSKVNQP